MTNLPAHPSGTPQELLASSRALSRRVRAVQRGSWFPLLMFGVATLLAAPVDHAGRSLTCQSSDSGQFPIKACSVYPTWSFVYWPIALVLAYVAISVFYVRRSSRRGVGTRSRPYVVAGLVLAVLLTAVSLWAAHHPLTQDDILGLHLRPGAPLGGFLVRLASPACAIGLALLVLARIERDWALLLFTAGYLTVVLARVGLGWDVSLRSSWAFLPHLLIAGGLLLIGSLGFALAQSGRRSAPGSPAPKAPGSPR